MLEQKEECQINLLKKDHIKQKFRETDNPF